jgi:L-threonine-O-3-phosphate decarboxylase
LRDFSASINPLGPPASAIAAMQAHLEQLARYPDPSYRELRQTLAQHHSLSPDWILPGNGVAELLTWMGRDLADLAATYLITPAFGDYRRALAAFKAQVVACPIPLAAAAAGEIDWLRVITHQLPYSPARCGLILNTPHNPTGLVIPIEALISLLEQFAYVVVDEAFMDFLPPEHQLSLIPIIEQWPNLVVLRSLTKFYSLPGLRLGYAISHPSRLQRWQQWRDPWPVNGLASPVTAAVLADHPFQQKTWQWLEAARADLWAQLQRLPELHPLPGQANYFLIRCERSGLQLQFDLLHHHRILVRDCLSFADLGDRYIRIAIKTPDDNAQLVHALQDVLSAPP